MSAPEETANPRDVMAIISHIGPDLSQEEAHRLLYPKTSEGMYLPWLKPQMKKDQESL